MVMSVMCLVVVHIMGDDGGDDDEDVLDDNGACNGCDVDTWCLCC